MAYNPSIYPEDFEDLQFAGHTLEPTGFTTGEPEAVFTGLLNSEGAKIMRHPVVMRFGFHPEDKKYYCPTLEDEHPDDAPIVGWSYAAG